MLVRMADGAVFIRPATSSDHGAIWSILEPTIRSGETCTLPRNLTREQGLEYWFARGHEVMVAELDEEIAGTYYLRANQPGGGAHVANCGYMTAVPFAGRGVARPMCAHSLQTARARGFRSMQFNFVVSTNQRAVRIWQSFGFAVVGRLPGAFRHPVAGLVDALVMFAGSLST